MKYDFKGNSIKEFSKLPRKAQLQIMEKLELYMSATSPLNFAEHLRACSTSPFRLKFPKFWSKKVQFSLQNPDSAHQIARFFVTKFGKFVWKARC